jgi:kojibiose phosphorylase
MLKNKFSNYLKDTISEDAWLVRQGDYQLNKNLVWETNFTLTNGYLGTRGAFEEGSYNQNPGTYIAGIFDQYSWVNEEIVNCPNWLPLTLYIDNEPVALDRCELTEFERCLDLRQGVLFRKTVLKDSKGRETLIEGLRFVSRANRHRAAIRLYITPLNYAGTLSTNVMALESQIDGRVFNWTRKIKDRVKHLTTLKISKLGGWGMYIETATRDRDLRVAQGSALRVNNLKGENIISERKFGEFGDMVREFAEFTADQGQTIVVDKTVVTFTSRDAAKEILSSKVTTELDAFTSTGIDAELKAHQLVYQDFWKRSDIEFEGDSKALNALRFNIFHLGSSSNEQDPNVSIAAKALHGEGYTGHVFWDTEIFMLPFFIYTQPEAAKALLRYRYSILDGARKNAALSGCKGARFPWEAAIDGKEECVKWVFDFGMNIRIWCGETEYHITEDVAYGIWDYYRATGDLNFMLKAGIETIVETARFWSTLAKWIPEKNRFEIHEVMGPDEFHLFTNNNAYTNHLAHWNICKALELLEMLKDKHPDVYSNLISKISLTPEDLKLLKNVKEKMYLPASNSKKIVEQFDGYFQKADPAITKLNEHGLPEWPEGFSLANVDDSQLIKQADVVMLMLLLPERFSPEEAKKSFEYYEKRSLHSSSLSASMYSIMGMRVGDPGKAYQYFKTTALVDLEDNQGNTHMGIHAASTGGCWQVVIYGFGGLSVDKKGQLNIDPCLPKEWKKMRYRVCWQGSLLEVIIENNLPQVKIIEGGEVTIKIKGQETKIK